MTGWFVRGRLLRSGDTSPVGRRRSLVMTYAHITSALKGLHPPLLAQGRRDDKNPFAPSAEPDSRPAYAFALQTSASWLALRLIGRRCGSDTAALHNDESRLNANIATIQLTIDRKPQPAMVLYTEIR